MNTGKDNPDSLFDTDHLKRDLGRRSLSGGLTVGAAQVARFALYVLTMAILARLLSVEDFGLVATVGALTSFLSTFQEGGLSTATIQRDRVTVAQVSNLFWINCALGALATVVAAASSPAVAWFFRDERLIHITMGLSVTFLITGATVQHQALLARQMRFTALSVITVSSMIFGLVIAVGLARAGFRYWSLVGLQIATPAWVLLASVFCTRWRPNLYSRRSGTRSMITLGANLTTAALLRSVAESIPMLLIGRAFGLTAAGYYSRAAAILNRPLNQLLAPFDRVMVPMLSRLQNNPERYRKAFLRVYGLIALTAFPVTALFFGLARPIVFLALGGGWDEVVPIFQALSVCMLYLPLSKVVQWLLTTQARSGDISRMGYLLPISTITSVLVGWPFGVVGIAWSISAFRLCVRLPLQYRVVGRSGAVTTGDLWSVYLRHLPSVPAVLAGIWLGEYLFPHLRPLAELGVGTALGLAFAAIVMMVIPAQRREFLSLLELRHALSTRGRYREPAPAATS